MSENVLQTLEQALCHEHFLEESIPVSTLENTLFGYLVGIKNKPLVWQIWALRNKTPAKLRMYWLSIARFQRVGRTRTFSQMT